MNNPINYHSTPVNAHHKNIKPQKQTIKSKLDRILKRDIQILQSTQSQKKPSLQIKNNNELVLQYVEQVYQEYQIINPLPRDNTRNYASNNLAQQKKTKKKIKLFVKTMKTQKYKTPQKNQDYFLADQVRNIDEQVQEQDESLNKSLLNNTKIKASLKYFDTSHVNQYQQATLNKHVRTDQQHNLVHTSQKMGRLQHKAYYVPEQFRYCIGCNEAILQHNIEFHQQTCREYKGVMAMEMSEIVEFLKKKISLCQKNIKQYSEIISSEDADNLNHFSAGMMDKSRRIVKEGHITEQYTEEYDKIVDIGRRWCLMTEEINRVNWFLKIRERLKSQLNI